MKLTEPGTNGLAYEDDTGGLSHYFAGPKTQAPLMTNASIPADLIMGVSANSADSKQSHNKPGHTPVPGPVNKYRNKKLYLLLIILILLLCFSCFSLLRNHSSAVDDLRNAQAEFQALLQESDRLSDDKLQSLADEVKNLRAGLDNDVPNDLIQQYDSVLYQLNILLRSSDDKTAQTARRLINILTNEPGIGIGLSGENRTTVANNGVLSLNNQTGNLSLQGTANQINVIQNGSTTNLATPQDIAPTSTPSFAGLQISNAITTGNLAIQSSGTQNGYNLCDASNNCGYTGADSSYVQGGNSFGNPAVLGTNDNQTLSIRTNGVNRLVVGADGNTGFAGNLTTPGSISASTVTATNFGGDGSGITNVDASALQGNNAAYFTNASNFGAGTLADARLSNNIPLKNGINTFIGTNNFGGVTATGILQGGFSVCDTSNNCNYASSSGSSNYIQNGTGVQVANFNIQSMGTANVGATVRAVTSQTADLQQWQNSSGTPLVSIQATGSIYSPSVPIKLGFGTALQGESSLGGSFADMIKRGSSNSVYVGSSVAGTTIDAAVNTIFSIGGTQRAVLSYTDLRPISASALSLGTVSYPWAQLHIKTVNSTSQGIVVTGSPSQTANLQEWQDSTGTLLGRVGADGQIWSAASVSSGYAGFRYTDRDDAGKGLVLGEAYSKYGLFSANSVGNVASPLYVSIANANESNGAFIRLGTGTGGSANYGIQLAAGGYNAGSGQSVSVNTWDGLANSANRTVRLEIGHSDNPSIIVRSQPAQTADLLQLKGISGVNVARFDISGNLFVRNASIEGDFITFSNNVRGYNLAVGAAAVSQTVTFSAAHSDTNYAVFCTPNWDTTCFISNKTTAGFTLNYGTAAPGSQLVDWFVSR